ncbi:MAG: hypothetical protein WA405_02520 [Candidatus Acidiferrales bacterium]
MDTKNFLFCVVYSQLAYERDELVASYIGWIDANEQNQARLNIGPISSCRAVSRDSAVVGLTIVSLRRISVASLGPATCQWKSRK